MTRRTRFITFLLVWLTCGFLASGVMLADFQSNDTHKAQDCRHDMVFASMYGVAGGPVMLLIALANTGFAEHGMQWTCRVNKEGN